MSAVLLGAGTGMMMMTMTRHSGRRSRSKERVSDYADTSSLNQKLQADPECIYSEQLCPLSHRISAPGRAGWIPQTGKSAAKHLSTTVRSGASKNPRNNRTTNPPSKRQEQNTEKSSPPDVFTCGRDLETHQNNEFSTIWLHGYLTNIRVLRCLETVGQSMDIQKTRILLLLHILSSGFLLSCSAIFHKMCADRHTVTSNQNNQVESPAPRTSFAIVCKDSTTSLMIQSGSWE